MREDSLEAIHEEIRGCERCPLCESRTLAVPGEGPADARVVLVGEAPGEQEDRSGRPFVGNAGRVLNRLLANAGLKREEIYLTGAVKCRPPGGRTPRASEIDACRNYLERQLSVIRPRVVSPMGRPAMRAAFGRGGDVPMAEARGKPREVEGITYLPIYHPAAAFYREELRSTLEEDMRRLGELAALAPRA